MRAFFSDKLLRFLTIVLLLLLVISAGVTVLALRKNSGTEWKVPAFSNILKNKSEDGCVLYDVSVKSVGKSYQGKAAEPGYTYYIMFMHVMNQGTSSKGIESLVFTPAEESWNDMIDGGYVSAGEHDSDFWYENMPIIPGGEYASVACCFQVRDGVEQIYVNYCDGDNLEDTTKLAITLN